MKYTIWMEANFVRVWGRNLSMCRLWEGILDETGGRQSSSEGSRWRGNEGSRI